LGESVLPDADGLNLVGVFGVFGVLGASAGGCGFACSGAGEGAGLGFSDEGVFGREVCCCCCGGAFFWASSFIGVLGGSDLLALEGGRLALEGGRAAWSALGVLAAEAEGVFGFFFFTGVCGFDLSAALRGVLGDAG
jgi:hypothetical protein